MGQYHLHLCINLFHKPRLLRRQKFGGNCYLLWSLSEKNRRCRGLKHSSKYSLNQSLKNPIYCSILLWVPVLVVPSFRIELHLRLVLFCTVSKTYILYALLIHCIELIWVTCCSKTSVLCCPVSKLILFSELTESWMKYIDTIKPKTTKALFNTPAIWGKWLKLKIVLFESQWRYLPQSVFIIQDGKLRTPINIIHENLIFAIFCLYLVCKFEGGCPAN